MDMSRCLTPCLSTRDAGTFVLVEGNRRPDGASHILDTFRPGSYDGRTVAVTVQQAAFVVLDAGDRIVGVGPHAESQFGPLVGSVMWDCFPGAEPLFKPYYDQARRSGECIEFVQYYDGYVARVRAAPRTGDELEVSWEQLTRIDTTTLGALSDSLAESLELLDLQERDANRDELRKTLQLIEGGA